MFRFFANLKYAHLRPSEMLWSAIVFGAVALVGPVFPILAGKGLEEIGAFGLLAVAVIGLHHWASAQNIERNVKPSKVADFVAWIMVLPFLKVLEVAGERLWDVVINAFT